MSISESNAKKMSDNALAGFGIILLSPILYLLLPASWSGDAHAGAISVAGVSFGCQIYWRLGKSGGAS